MDDLAQPGSKGATDTCTDACTVGEPTIVEEIVTVDRLVFLRKPSRTNPTAHISSIIRRNVVGSGSQEDLSNAKMPISGNNKQGRVDHSSPHNN